MKIWFKNFLVFVLVAAFVLSFVLLSTGCEKLNGEIFGFKFGKAASGEETAENSSISGEGSEESSADSGEDKETTPDNFYKDSTAVEGDGNGTENNAEENNTDIAQKDDNTNLNVSDQSGEDSSDDSDNADNYTADEISQNRQNFKEAVDYFEDGSYTVAEYNLNKIKDDYIILQDHVFYYLAKSLLMQEKYDRSKEYYIKLIENYPDSIWKEKAELELADLLYLTEDYINAEEKYSVFITGYNKSEYFSYANFQLAVCREKNGKFKEAGEEYKNIWRSFPASEYAALSMDNINRLSGEGLIESYTPTAQEVFNRAEIFFGLYVYQNALQEYSSIINSAALMSQATTELNCRILFKMGMCYYNLRDYGNSKNYLLQSYQKSVSSSVADDCLYYLGRVFTNLDSNDDAISYYQKLVSDFPQSNFSDDALYRAGRIYISMNDYKSAIASFKKVFESYPDGDKILDSLWELSWVEYKSGDFNSAKNDFGQLSASGKGTLLEEKGLFWQAKCCQKLGQTETAVNLCREIINIKAYSYYTFAAKTLAATLGTELQIPEIDSSLNPQNEAIKNVIPEIFAGIEKDISVTDITGSSVDHITKALELIKIEYYFSASLEIEAGSSELKTNPDKILELATLYLKANDYSNSIKIVNQNKKAFNTGGLKEAYNDYSYYLLYPYAYEELIDKYSVNYGVESLFTLSVIRQESSFKPDAGSYAGAMGLMQIMPATGKSIAGRIGISGFESSMLFDPEISINMGTYYLKEQLAGFNQNKVFCLGAYNGGPGAMREWINKWGNLDQDEFIENIPYLETKDYIKRVMGNYYFYQLLYGE